VTISGRDRLLLKKDGTLWLWESWDYDSRSNAWPGMRGFQPYRLGTASNWTEIAAATSQIYSRDESWLYAWDDQGQAWTLTGPFNPTRAKFRAKGELSPGNGLERFEKLDHSKW